MRDKHVILLTVNALAPPILWSIKMYQSSVQIITKSTAPHAPPAFTVLLPDCPSHTLTHSLNDSMIFRVRSSLIQHRDRLPIQGHIVPLESNIPHLRHVLISLTPVIFKEQGHRCCRVPLGTIERDFENIRFGASKCLRNLKGLGWLKVGGGGEIEIGTVAEELDGLWSGGSRGGVD